VLTPPEPPQPGLELWKVSRWPAKAPAPQAEPLEPQAARTDWPHLESTLPVPGEHPTPALYSQAREPPARE
jgi:hypothetical protein